MEAQLRRVGLPYELVEAVDGRDLTAVERAKLIDEQHVKDPGWMSPGVVGCALSHWHVFRRIAEEEDDAALVLEDDAVLSADVTELTDRISWHMHGREIILLYFLSFEPCRLSEEDGVSVGRHRLLYPVDVHQPGASTAYLVSRDAARSLSKAVVPLRGLAADSWGHYYELGVFDSLRCVLPRPVRVDTSLESTLGYGDHTPLRRRLKQETRWPLPQLRALNRRRIAWNMTKVAVVPEVSPVSQRLAQTESSR